MKIWSCLCFSEGEEEEEEEEEKAEPEELSEGEERGDDMKEAGFENGSNFEGNMGIAGGETEAGDSGGGGNGHARLIDGMAEAASGGLGVGDASGLIALSATMRASRRALGEGSSSSSAAAVAVISKDCDHDSHHKRAKVHSDFHACSYSSAISLVSGSCSSSGAGDYDITHGSYVASKNDVVYHTFMLNNTGEDDQLIMSSEGDHDGDEAGPSRTEDSEVRMDLTDDLLHMVFSFLDHIDLCRAAIVCSQWRAASAHEDFWRCLNFENQSISVEQFADMCRRYPIATEVNVSGTPAIHLLVMKAVSSLRNLEVLTLGKGHLGDVFFHSLAHCNMLRRLNINDATLGNGIQEIPLNHDRLRHVQITKCRVMRISMRCPQLETLSLKRSNMAQAVLNCPLLQDLDVGSCHKLSDAAIRSAALSCPQLVSLDISNCSCVSDETLREISHNCANLHVLDASYCPNITLESARFQMLTVLKLDSCEGITSASMAWVAISYNLEVLELDNCSLLSSVSLELPRLQNIRLVHCRKLADLNLRSVMLSSIMVSNCPLLKSINLTSNSLQKLSLQKQESLTTLALQCNSLQEVDLTDCESLTNSICDVFSDNGGSPMLKSLVLANCESLTAVQFSSTSLVSLSLDGCRGITSLKLECPYLKKVSLDGCDHLERAEFWPVGLQSLNLGICPKLNVLGIEAPNMELLELKGCGVLSEASIKCPLLTSLDASFCSQLKDDCLSATTASCPKIESLILMSCPSVGSDGLYSLSCLQHLTVLDLSYTFLTNLQPIFDSCVKLKVLKLQACKYLTHSSLEPLYKQDALPSLEELDLSYGTLCQSAIEELLACCTHLTHVSLNGCIHMHDLNWAFGGGSVSGSSGMLSPECDHDSVRQPNRLLQNLNCVGCPNIKKVLIPPAARCFHLSSLNLSLSVHLKEVDLACFNLCFLNLSNCYSLEVLKLDCPKLTSLFLQSCNIDEAAVEVAISKCGMLETLDVRFCPKISSTSMGMLRAACLSLKRIFSSLSHA